MWTEEIEERLREVHHKCPLEFMSISSTFNENLTTYRFVAHNIQTCSPISVKLPHCGKKRMYTKYVNEATPETIAKQAQLKDRVRESFLINPVIKLFIRTGRMKLLDIPAMDNCYCL